MFTFPDNNKDGGPYKWRNGQTVTYKWWAAAHNTPANTRGRQDCAYVSTSKKTKMSRSMTKPANDTCDKRRLRSAWVSVQCGQSLHCENEEAVREDSDQPMLRLSRL